MLPASHSPTPEPSPVQLRPFAPDAEPLPPIELPPEPPAAAPVVQPDLWDDQVKTVADGVKKFLAHKSGQVGRAGGIKPRTLEQLERYCRSFSRKYGAKPIEKCRPSDIDNWLADHKETWTEGSTLRSAVDCVLRCFRWLANDNFIPRNPYRKPKLPPSKPLRPMSPAHYQAIMDAARSCDGRDPARLLPTKTVNGSGKIRTAKHLARGQMRRACAGRLPFRLALFCMQATGCRECEMREAVPEQIDWTHRLLITHEHKTVGSTGRPRIFPLRPLLFRVIRMLCRQRRPGQKIFLTSRGVPWKRNTFATQFRQYADLAGVPRDIKAYATRHLNAVEGKKRGVSNGEIADLFGHTSTRYVDAAYGVGAKDDADYLHGIIERIHGQKAAPKAQESQSDLVAQLEAILAKLKG